MKHTEFHRQIERNGWKYSHAEGSHYFYLKDGILSPPIPYHGAKEMYEPLRRSIVRTKNNEAEISFIKNNFIWKRLLLQ